VVALYLSDFSIRGAVDRNFGQDIKWDIDLLSGYEARFVRGAGRRNEPAGFFSMLVPRIWREVAKGGFAAVVVHGHTPAAMVLAATAARLTRTPVFMRCETHLGLRRSWFKTWLRRRLLGVYYRMFDGVLAIGSANREFYQAMGVPDDRIFMMPYAVDNARFATAAQLTPAERQDLRASLGVSDARPIVLYAAKFQRRKRPGDLLRAAARLNRERLDFHLLIVGSGELAAELQELAASLRLGNLSFCGFINQAALPRYYAASDVFILPSEDEPWGLAVNEAMCAGLPIVAAAEIGCVRDLVRDGINGHTFPVGNIDALTGVLRSLLSDPTRRRTMGAASRAMIAAWSYAECAAGLRDALGGVGVRSLRGGVA
jgi:glycosyltransferase involved in cell wall biosynthesis